MTDRFHDRQTLPPNLTPVSDTASLRSLFRHTFVSATPGNVLDLSPLHQEVCAFVRMERERGQKAERVITTLKEMMSAEAQWQTPAYEQRALRDALIRWCLDEYYGPANAPSIAARQVERLFRVGSEGLRPIDRR